MVLLPDVTSEIAEERAEGLRHAVAALRLAMDREVYNSFTVSIGFALYPNDGEGCDLLLHRADMALYRAKRMGRNQVARYVADAVMV